MSPEDEQELHRLCEILRDVERALDANSPQREAVTKAALGLSLAFMRNLRPEIENLALGVGRPLDDEQRAHLWKMGIDPDVNA